MQSHNKITIEGSGFPNLDALLSILNFIIYCILPFINVIKPLGDKLSKLCLLQFNCYQLWQNKLKDILNIEGLTWRPTNLRYVCSFLSLTSFLSSDLLFMSLFPLSWLLVLIISHFVKRLDIDHPKLWWKNSYIITYIYTNLLHIETDHHTKN